MTPTPSQLKLRLHRILDRFIDLTDLLKTDDEFIHAVLARYEHHRKQPLIDPAE